MTAKIQELKSQHNEANIRCEAAATSVEVAQGRLDEALSASRDTSKARAVLKQCQQLFKEAENQRSQVEAQISKYYNAQDDKRASEIAASINAGIAVLLKPFDLTKYQEIKPC